MNALIFLVPEDIVDVRPRLVRCYLFTIGKPYIHVPVVDLDVRG